MTKHSLGNPQAHDDGFTLIELLIALAIIGILAMLAFPSYKDSVHKSHRADAFAAVSAIQLAQERWRANNALYSITLSDLNVTAPSNYTLTIAAPPSPDTRATGYEITAVGTGSQADDRSCQRMGVRVVAGNLTYAGCSNCANSDLVFGASHACWAR